MMKFKHCFLLLFMLTLLLPELLSQQNLCYEHFPRKFSNDTTVTLCNGQIDIDSEILIKDVIYIHFKSYGDGYTELVCMHTVTGFKFLNVIDLQISNIIFSGCGRTIDYQGKIDNSIVSLFGAVVISHCQDVTLNNVTVQNSVGSGLILNQTNGTVLIKNSSFDRNCKNRSALAIAGGLYIELLHTHVTTSELTSAYSIDGCRFINNSCQVSSIIDGIGSAIKYQGYNEGGGMKLLFYSSNNNCITIKNSVFSNNSGLSGGGFAVHYFKSPENNSLIIQSCQFVKNHCFYRGGGIDIGFVANFSETNRVIELNIVKFQNCTIKENKAKEYGAGVRIYSSRNKFVAITVTFSECSFSNNKALYGPAVDMFPFSFYISKDGYLMSVSFKDCNFTSNKVAKKLVNDPESVHSIYKYYESGKGAFSCASFSVFIHGRTIFSNNQGSAMHLSSCKVHFEQGSRVTFNNNTGYDGGAIVILGASVLYVSDNSTILFSNNTATYRGGAIMYFSYSEHHFIALKSCFIEYLGPTSNINDRLIDLNFTNNNALYGHSIFASTLKPCQRLCIEKQGTSQTVSTNISIKESLGCIGNLIIENSSNIVSTSGEKLVAVSNLHGKNVLLVTPGQEIKLEFNMSNELSEQTYDTFRVSIQNQNKGGSVKIDPAYTYVAERKVIKLYGKPEDKADVVLTNAEFQPVTILVSIEMQHCPPGFVLSENSNKTSCICSTETQNKRYIGVTGCDSKTRRAYVQSGYWVGYKNVRKVEEELITGQCPRGFCQYHNIKNKTNWPLNVYKLPKDPSVKELDTFICGNQRTGKLCGRCREDHSVFFHSKTLQCRPNDHTCRVSLLLYFLSEILPVTLFFVVIIIFDIHFTSGTLNSLLFFIQMIDALAIDVKGIVRPHQIVNVMIKANQFLYGIFNLNFFTLDSLSLSFCMWSKATTLDILAFKYITIIYSLILIIVTVVCVKFCNPRVFKKLFPRNKKFKQFSAHTSVIHGLVAFFVVCYAQCTEVSLSILTPGEIHFMGYPKNHKVLPVVYFSGDMLFMKREHLKYAIPALIFSITFTIIPPLLLIIYPLCYKVFAFLRLQESMFVRALCILIPLEKSKPLFDSFQGCFKDDRRFFAGLYFIYRFLALMNYAITDSLTLFYTLLEVQLIITLIIHALVQPYKQKWHNKIDILLLGTLVLINAMTMYTYQNTYRDRLRYKIEINLVSACQVIFAFLPLICLSIYGAKKVLMRCTCKSVRRKTKSRDEELTDTLTLVDVREDSYTESGYHKF